MISIFRNAKSKKEPIHLEMWQIVERIRNGNSKNRINEIRKAIAKGERKQAGAYKLNLPSICFSGKFELRKDESIMQHSGFICLDFDHIDVEEIDSLKAMVSEITYTYAVFVSPSGEGLKLLVRVPGSMDMHRDHYRAAMRFYSEATHGKITPDIKCINESRICFESYDPDIAVNINSSVFTERLNQDGWANWVKPKEKTGQVLVPPSLIPKRNWADHVTKVTTDIINSSTTGGVHDALMRASNLMGGYIGAGHIDEQTGRSHLQTLITAKQGVSSQAEDHKKIEDGIAYGRLKPVVLDTKYSFEGEKFEPYSEVDKAIYAEAMQYIKDGNELSAIALHIDNIAKSHSKDLDYVQKIFTQAYERHKSIFNWNNWLEIERVEHFLGENYDFIRNMITLQTDVKPKGAAQYDELNEDSIFRAMQHGHFKFPLDKLKSLLRSDFVESYHPIQEYFDNLKEWDSKTDHIAKLAGYVKTSDPEFFASQLTKCLVRCIACSTTSYVNRIVFTLVGESQETGKSSFIRFLNPFGEKLYSEAPMKDNKDTEIAFAENFIYNMEELAALKVYEVDKLKSVISRGLIKERESYGKRAQARQRICNFFASTNNKEFLTDSENTRWMIFDVISINHDYCNYITGVNEVDINDVWSQAMSLYKNGYEFHLTEQERHKRDLNNKEYEVVSPEREIIMKYLQVCSPEEGGFMCNTDIQVLINAVSQGSMRINTKAIGVSMKALGFYNAIKRVNRHTVRGYHVIVKPITEDPRFEDAEIILKEGVYTVSQTKLFNQ